MIESIYAHCRLVRNTGYTMTLIQLLFFCLLGITSLHGVTCANEGCATTTVNIRNRASTKSIVLGQLRKGSCLPYEGVNWRRNWAKVSYKGNTAWIYKKYLKVRKSKQTSTSSWSASASGSFNCFGDVMQLRPTGAGPRTSKGLGFKGVAASYHMVDQDISDLNKRKSCYVEAGRNNCIHPAVIAAVASRETRGGRLLSKTNGWGDHGRAWGIMQCDVHTSGLGKKCQKYRWDSCEHINQMTSTILVPNIKRVKNKHPSWPAEHLLQGGVAAYNFGVKNVGSWAQLDRGSTGDDYSNDVIARAQRLITKHGW